MGGAKVVSWTMKGWGEQKGGAGAPGRRQGLRGWDEFEKVEGRRGVPPGRSERLGRDAS